MNTCGGWWWSLNGLCWAIWLAVSHCLALPLEGATDILPVSSVPVKRLIQRAVCHIMWQFNWWFPNIFHRGSKQHPVVMGVHVHFKFLRKSQASSLSPSFSPSPPWSSRKLMTIALMAWMHGFVTSWDFVVAPSHYFPLILMATIHSLNRNVQPWVNILLIDQLVENLGFVGSIMGQGRFLWFGASGRVDPSLRRVSRLKCYLPGSFAGACAISVGMCLALRQNDV